MTTSQDTRMPHYSYDALIGWLQQVFAACGLESDAAKTAATTLVRTNARGIDTHGVTRVLVYAQKLKSGEINAAARPRLEDRHGVLHYHADGALGQSAGIAAVDTAVQAAGRQASVTMVVHEIGHLAALGMFVLRAAEAGMLALLAQSFGGLLKLCICVVACEADLEPLLAGKLGEIGLRHTSARLQGSGTAFRLLANDHSLHSLEDVFFQDAQLVAKILANAFKFGRFD